MEPSVYSVLKRLSVPTGTELSAGKRRFLRTLLTTKWLAAELRSTELRSTELRSTELGTTKLRIAKLRIAELLTLRSELLTTLLPYAVSLMVTLTAPPSCES